MLPLRLPLSWLLCAVVAVGVVTALACRSEPTLTAPAAAGARHALNPKAGDAVGCVVLAGSDRQSRSVTFLQRQIPFGVVPISEAIRSRTGVAIMHVVTAEGTFDMNGTATQIAVACIVPTTVSLAKFRLSVQKTPAAVWKSISARLSNPQATPTGRLDALAVAAALRSVAVAQSGATLRATALKTPSRAAFNNLSTPTLPTMYAVADYNYGIWYFDLSEVMWAFEDDVYDLWDGSFVVSWYYNNVCPDASAAWFATSDALTKEVQDSVDYAAAYEAVASYECPQTANPDWWCMDFWIASKNALLMNGDDRSSVDTAGIRASRVQAMFKLVRGGTDSGYFMVNTSSATVPRVTGTFPFVDWTVISSNPYPHQPKNMTILTVDDTTKYVVFKFFNGFCQNINAELICPAVDGNLRLKFRSGSWQPDSVDRDAYPSLDVYHRENGEWLLKIHSPEAPGVFGPFQLWQKHGTLDSLRAQLDRPLPPGCNLQ